MKCPWCANEETAVLDSRATEDSIRRRRECAACDRRFTTYERAETLELMVVKKDGRREFFNREKIKAGFLRACEKRPISMDTIENLVQEIEANIREMAARGKSEIPTREIGELVMRALKKLDKVAYIRFASVYREFQDVSSFEKEIRSLMGGRQKTKMIKASARISVSKLPAKIPRGERFEKPQLIAKKSD